MLAGIVLMGLAVSLFCLGVIASATDPNMVFAKAHPILCAAEIGGGFVATLCSAALGVMAFAKVFDL